MNEIIKAVSILGLTLMGSGFIIGLFDYLKSKAENSPTLKEKIEIIENIIESSVIYINQTFVDILKENDDFDNNEKYEAFNKAKKLILSQLSTDLLKVIKDIYGDKLTIAEFESSCKCNALTSDDGFGHYADDEYEYNICVNCSNGALGKSNKNFKYVIWYNK